jgi:hypothetical protein
MKECTCGKCPRSKASAKAPARAKPKRTGRTGGDE